MGPSIVLDKSSLQTLSLAEIAALKRFYSVTLIPTLVIEILADLKKTSTGDRTPEEEVVQLANKLSQMDSAINIHHFELIVGSLLGRPVPMSRRPIVPAGKYVRAADGKIGVVFEETSEERAILRWQDGLFSDAEAAVAEQWRHATKSIDLEGFKNSYKATGSFRDCRNLEEIVTRIDEYLHHNDSQSELLKMILLEFGIEPRLASIIFMRWEGLPTRSVSSFAPYALYCFRANIVFYLGLALNLVGTRPTNRIDLEYTYYLPFCSVFSSKDKFHKLLIPFFLESDQKFVSGEDLKADLARLKDQRLTNTNSGPPKEESSSTYQAWKQSVPHWHPEIHLPKSDKPPKADPRIANELKELSDAQEITDPEILRHLNMGNVDFMIRKRTIRLDDPCMCHSGKKFRDCHWRPSMKPM